MKITIIALAALLPVSQAAAGEHSKKDIRMLNEAAAALSAKDEALAGRLRDYAAREGSETEENAAAEEASRGDDVRMLRDAAADLKDSKPGLSRDLRRFAAKEEGEGRRGERSPHRPISMPGDY